MTRPDVEAAEAAGGPPPGEQIVFHCPVEAPIGVLGGKWKLVLLYYLLEAPRRNGELRRLVPSITQKMLTQQLRELEADGIVTRAVHDQVPPKVVYAVADDQRPRLDPLVSALCDWGLYWCDRIDARVLVLEQKARERGARTSAD